MEAFALRTDILGVGFDDLTLEEAVARGTAFLEEDRFHYVVTPNPELVDRASREGAFREALNGADLVLPDGIGVIYAARILGRPLKGRCPGIDFASGLMASMAAGGKRLYLLGAKPGVAEAAARNLEARYPGLSICGTHDGYFQEDGPVVEELRRSGAGGGERAPESWQKMGLEWLYRLMKEPSRIGRMARLPLFLASALGERCKRKGG